MNICAGQYAANNAKSNAKASRITKEERSIGNPSTFTIDALEPRGEGGRASEQVHGVDSVTVYLVPRF